MLFPKLQAVLENMSASASLPNPLSFPLSLSLSASYWTQF